MQKVWLHDPPCPEGARLPTEDELPYSDGMPMESERHVLQMYLLREALALAWADRSDFYIGADMFVYFSPLQVLTADFRGLDLFVALDVPRRERKSWVVWEEGKGPDLVIELLSDSTADVDRIVKKRIYRDRLQVPEYIWYHPFTGELAGFRLDAGEYRPIPFDERGALASAGLGLALVRWRGAYAGVDAPWLRWAAIDGTLLPTEAEVAQRERRRATREASRAERAEALAEAQRREIEALRELLAQRESER